MLRVVCALYLLDGARHAAFSTRERMVSDRSALAFHVEKDARHVNKSAVRT